MLALYFLFSIMGVNELKTSKQNSTEINEFCMTKRDLLSWYKSQQKLLEITLRFSWKVNEFQWTQLLIQVLSFISIMAKQNHKQNLIQRKRYPEFQGMQDRRKLWEWCIDDGITVPSHCVKQDSDYLPYHPWFHMFTPSWWKKHKGTIVLGIPLHRSITVEDNSWSPMEEIIYSWSAKWQMS